MMGPWLCLLFFVLASADAASVHGREKRQAEGCRTVSIAQNNGFEYAYLKGHKTFSEAQALCRSCGPDVELVSVHTADEQNYIRNHFINESDYTFWLGLSDAATEGQWLWLDGTPLDYNNWKPEKRRNNGAISRVAEPDNISNDGSPNADCAFVSSDDDGSWKDLDCSETKKVVCKRSLGQPQGNPSTNVTYPSNVTYPPANVTYPPSGNFTYPPANVTYPPSGNFTYPPANVTYPPSGNFTNPPANVTFPPSGNFTYPPANATFPPSGNFTYPPANVTYPPSGNVTYPPSNSTYPPANSTVSGNVTYSLLNLTATNATSAPSNSSGSGNSSIAAAPVAENPYRRTAILIKKSTMYGQNVFIRGGRDGGEDSSIPIEYRDGDHSDSYNSWSEGDTVLDWEGKEENQGDYKVGFLRRQAHGSPAEWTTNNPNKDSYNALNTEGDDYWLLDVDMDCSKTNDGLFQFKGVFKNYFGSPSWENDISGSNNNQCSGMKPVTQATNNHVAECGKLNIYQWNDANCQTKDFP